MADPQPNRWYRSWPGIVFLTIILVTLLGLVYTLATQEPDDGVGTQEGLFGLPPETESE